jgi:hypothetical protein
MFDYMFLTAAVLYALFILTCLVVSVAVGNYTILAALIIVVGLFGIVWGIARIVRWLVER